MSPSLADDETHVWSALLSEDLLTGLPDVLDSGERERAQRFVFARDQHRFRCGRTVLRLLLASYLDSEPQDIQFSYGPDGKPGVAGLQFNASHSNDFAVIAVTRSAHLGVDIEQAREVDEARETARHYFSPAEQAALERVPDEQSAAFLRCWTRKEAVVKALGGGLTIDLCSFDVSIGDGDARLLEVRDDATRAADWRLYDLSVNGLFGALAVVQPPAWHRVKRFDFTR